MFRDPGLDIGEWIALIVGAVVLLYVVARLMTPLNTALREYAANETTFGPIVQLIVPILIGAGILMAYVAAFLGAVGYFGKK